MVAGRHHRDVRGRAREDPDAPQGTLQLPLTVPGGFGVGDWYEIFLRQASPPATPGLLSPSPSPDAHPTPSGTGPRKGSSRPEAEIRNLLRHAKKSGLKGEKLPGNHGNILPGSS